MKERKQILRGTDRRGWQNASFPLKLDDGTTVARDRRRMPERRTMSIEWVANDASGVNGPSCSEVVFEEKMTQESNC